MAGLNKRQKEFAIQYVRTGNAYESAVSAGYSAKYAKASSSKLRENAVIKAYIDKITKKSFQRDIMTAEEAMARLSHIARADITVKTIVQSPVGYDEVEVPPTFTEQNTALKEILKRVPFLTEADKLKIAEMKQKQSEKDVDIAIKKRKLEILSGANDENIDQVSKLLDKVDDIYSSK